MVVDGVTQELIIFDELVEIETSEGEEGRKSCRGR